LYYYYSIHDFLIYFKQKSKVLIATVAVFLCSCNIKPCVSAIKTVSAENSSTILSIAASAVAASTTTSNSLVVSTIAHDNNSVTLAWQKPANYSNIANYNIYMNGNVLSQSNAVIQSTDQVPTVFDVTNYGANGDGWKQGAPAPQTGFPDSLPSTLQTVAQSGILAANQYNSAISKRLSKVKAYATRSNLLYIRHINNVYLGDGLSFENPSKQTIGISHCNNLVLNF
jgi:exo-poly-alpha-galacturonosidase